MNVNESFHTADASLSALQGPPRIPPEEALMSRSFMYPGASYRNGKGKSRRTYIMSHKDAELWDEVARFKEAIARRNAKPAPSSRADSFGSFASVSEESPLFPDPGTTSNKKRLRKTTGRPLALATRDSLQQQEQQQQQLQLQLHQLAHRSFDLDWAFDEFGERDHSDAVLQAFFSMEDSDTDDSDFDDDVSEDMPQPSTRNSPIPSAPSTTRNSQIPVLNDLMVSWDSDESKKPPRTCSKLTWDMVILYNMGQLSPDIEKKRLLHGPLTTPHSLLLYRDQLSLLEYQQLLTVKKGFDERCKLIDQLLQQGFIIMIQRGRKHHERVMRLLCPFEALIKEAEAIELRKTLR
ncbi:UNVERIFIED_CONTAM: hypothetical protein HDU68_012281, partial [Siphonaria sp. JEL0065]